MAEHRRPSKAVRIAALVGVTGAVIAAPLLTAASASAASVATWNAVAMCESSGNWANHDSGHNKHYGGLQFSQSSWAAAGGLAYASRADYATKDQQIAVAERLLAMQGPGAWECAAAGGLTAGGPAANVRPTAAAPAGAAHISTVTAQAKPVSAPKPPATPVDQATRLGPARGSYTVKPGDTLSLIARANHVPGGWHRLYDLNRGTVTDANLIFPGQHLRLG